MKKINQITKLKKEIKFLKLLCYLLIRDNTQLKENK